MEDNLYFKYIKLSSGESIVCTTTDNYENVYKQKTISVYEPVVLNPMRIPRGDVLVESYIMYPWFSFSQELEYKIPTSQIVLMVNIKENLKTNYLRYLSQQDDSDDLLEDDYTEDEEGMIEEFLNNFGEDNDKENNDGSIGSALGRNPKLLH
jgi:hypothetical protein